MTHNFEIDNIYIMKLCCSFLRRHAVSEPKTFVYSQHTCVPKF